MKQNCNFWNPFFRKGGSKFQDFQDLNCEMDLIEIVS